MYPCFGAISTLYLYYKTLQIASINTYLEGFKYSLYIFSFLVIILEPIIHTDSFLQTQLFHR